MALIELLGPAGSGKTTLANHLLLTGKVVANTSLTRKIINSLLASFLIFLSFFSSRIALKTFNFLFFIINNSAKKRLYADSRALIYGLRYILSVKMSLKWRVKRIKLFSDAFCKFLQSNKLSFNYHVFLDEGPAQRATSLLYSNITIDNILSYIDICPLPDFLVILKIDQQTLTKRILEREGAENSYYYFRQDAIDLVDSIARAYLNRGCKVLELDATLSAEKNSRIVMDEINSTLNLDS